MTIARSFFSALFIVGIVGATGTAFSSGAILLKQEVAPGSNYCHMKFPAIRDDTLNWQQPVLQDSNTGDVIDFYGSCDESPAGQAQVNLPALSRAHKPVSRNSLPSCFDRVAEVRYIIHFSRQEA